MAIHEGQRSVMPPNDVDLEQQLDTGGAGHDPQHSSRQWSFGRALQMPLRSREESHVAELDEETKDLRHQAMHSLFGLPSSHLTEWNGLSTFFDHLESCFEELLDPRFKCVWKLLGRNAPSRSVDVWHWCIAVIDAYEGIEQEDPSIEAVYHRIRETFDTRILGQVPLPEEEKMHTLQAVFAVLCWMTSTLKPVIGENGTRRFLSMHSRDGSDEEGEMLRESSVLFAENCSHTYASTDLRRPTSKMFYSFQPRPEGIDGGDLLSVPLVSPAALTQAPGYNSEDVLHESSLNYASLSEIGRVRIKWVDTLTAHLVFDRATRELSVYRYPSYCVAKILSQHKVEVLDSIVERLLLSPYLSGSSQEPALIYREVLLSYRLLFGQSKKSREKIGRILSRSFRNARAPPSNAGETLRKREEVDPFLRILCTSRLNPAPRFLSRAWDFGKKPKPEIRGDLFPSSAVNVDDELLESDTYSASDDFPTFGSRLLALQRYNMRRQPSKMTDLWRDRRNPLQWYTFWAVVLVGGAGVVLALLQLVTGIIQAAYTINQKR